jgi:hypothetical protein
MITAAAAIAIYVVNMTSLPGCGAAVGEADVVGETVIVGEALGEVLWVGAGVEVVSGGLVTAEAAAEISNAVESCEA